MAWWGWKKGDRQASTDLPQLTIGLPPYLFNLPNLPNIIAQPNVPYTCSEHFHQPPDEENLTQSLAACLKSLFTFGGAGSSGFSLTAVCRLLVAAASLVGQHRLQAPRFQQLHQAVSVIEAHRLSFSSARGIFLDQGTNPCPLHCQTDSLPQDHQESPILFFFPIEVLKTDLQCFRYITK